MVMPLRLPTYTVDDLDSFPDDGNRYELLNGVLLVTPQASHAHQVVVTRLMVLLANYLHPSGKAYVVGPGAVELRPHTHLEPDILVVPGRPDLSAKWSDLSGWWLAVEVLSRSSRIYDRDYKRPAYLDLGLREVWLVDIADEVVYVSTRKEEETARRHRFSWHPAEMPEPLLVDLDRLFEDVTEGWEE